MKNILYKSLILLSALFYFGHTQANQSIIDTASNQYNRGEYEKCIASYQSLLNAGMESAELYYNLGNAYFKSNKIAQAILNYERAIKLNPKDEDILFNLNLANTNISDKMEIMPEFFLKTWVSIFQEFLSSNTWALISLSTFILTLLAFLTYFMSGRIGFKKAGFWIGLVLLLVSIGSFNFSAKSKHEAENAPSAIVITPTVTGKSSPDISGTELFVIHEGIKVTRVDIVGEWCEIRLPDGNKGWVKISDIEVI